MSDHLVLCADRLITSESLQPMEGHQMPVSSGECSSSCIVDKPDHVIDVEGRTDSDVNEEEEPLIQKVECRICQEEGSIKNLEVPCACSGSLKFAHRKCVQRWCNEKGDTTCEICHQPYQPGYTAPPPPPQPEDSVININGLTISGSALDARDPRILALAAAERHFLEAEYDDYADTGASGASFCRSVALILMALLLLRHAMTLTDDDGDDDASKIFSIFLLRAAGFLLPCYIMAWAVSILQRRRQRQEAAAIAASEVAFMLEAGQRRGIHVMIAPGSTVIPNQAVTTHQEQTQ